MDTTPTPKKKAKAKPVQKKFGSEAEMRQYVAAAESPQGDRMVKKVAAAAVVDVPAAPVDPVSEGVWGPKPSVAHQRAQHPMTCRTKLPVTGQFVLSDPSQLAAWNELQARLHPPDAPQAELGSYDIAFAPAISSYVIVATFSEIEYQQLI